MTPPTWFLDTHAKAVQLAARAFPYVLGGGHNPRFEASTGIFSATHVRGYDCSGIDSAAVHAGSPDELPFPLATHEIARWGLGGVGEWMTWWVFNGILKGIPTEHCVLEFMKGVPADQRFLMAFHTDGPPCGFRPFFDTTGYSPRRRHG